MSFLSRAEIGPAHAIGGADATKARKLVSEVEWFVSTVHDVVADDDGHLHFSTPHGIDVRIHDDGPMGVSLLTADARERTRKRAIHVHGRPAHFPEAGADGRSLLHLVTGLALQCVRVASSTKAMKTGDPRMSHSDEARRHAQRLCAEAVASGYVPSGRVGEEVWVRHPWGDAPALERFLLESRNGTAIRASGPSEAPLLPLLSVAIVGESGDRDLHVGGMMRTASPSAVATDAVEMMRLIAELDDIRAAAATAGSFTSR